MDAGQGPGERDRAFPPPAPPFRFAPRPRAPPSPAPIARSTPRTAAPMPSSSTLPALAALPAPSSSLPPSEPDDASASDPDAAAAAAAAAACFSSPRGRFLCCLACPAVCFACGPQKYLARARAASPR
jgi:hypothetical protein